MSERGGAPQDIGSYVAALEERVRRLEAAVSIMSSNHGLLEGLLDSNDHPQYLRKDGGKILGEILVFNSDHNFQTLDPAFNGAFLMTNDQTANGTGVEWRLMPIYFDPWALQPSNSTPTS